MLLQRNLFNEEQHIFRDAVRQFYVSEVEPFHQTWEKEGQVPRDLWLKAGKAGLLCLTTPEIYGGGGVDFLYSAIMMEEQAKVYASGPGFSLHSDIVAPYILHHGSDFLKQKYLPKLATGEMIGAIAMTEPGTGSDLQGIKTTAILKEDKYILNGVKTFITNGYLSDLVIVVAKTNPEQGAQGISLFLVETAWKGFSKGPKLNKIGMKAQDTCELFFDEIEVPKENLLGFEGTGFMYLMSELPQERLLIALIGQAAMEVCLQDTIQYTHDRQAFGREIFQFQNTKFKLAELCAEINMSRAFVDNCLSQHLKNELTVPMAAMVKLTTTELQCRVMDELLQLHGGYGYIWDYKIARAYADSRVQKIYGGTNEIMKDLISRSL